VQVNNNELNSNEGKIVAMRMVSGEEIVTKLGDLIDGNRQFLKPRVLVIMNQNGRPSAGLIPWFHSDPDACPMVNQDAIMAIIEAPKQVADVYREETTGLAIAH
jgi:hypothetical protein